jgi:hypothetical protein
MRRQDGDGRMWLTKVVWFALVMGLTARLGDEVRLYCQLRERRLQAEREVATLRRQVRLLENKLRYLHTPDGIRFAHRLQGIAQGGERLFVLDGVTPFTDIVELLPGGLEEWQNAQPSPPQRHRPPSPSPLPSPTRR